MERFSDLRQKEVINVLDGKRLGCVYDLVIEPEKGHITAIIVPCGNRITSFFKGAEDIVIPWSRIVKLGDDVILVECGDRPHHHDHHDRRPDRDYRD